MSVAFFELVTFLTHNPRRLNRSACLCNGPFVHLTLVPDADVVSKSVAGSETTAQSLAYATWELARHPDIQSRLREEVMAFAGSPSYDELQTQLPYLDAVTREVYVFYIGRASVVLPIQELTLLSRLVSVCTQLHLAWSASLSKTTYCPFAARSLEKTEKKSRRFTSLPARYAIAVHAPSAFVATLRVIH